MPTTLIGAIKQLALAETYIDPDTGAIKVSDSFPITPSFGAVWYRSIDFGFPDVRASAQDNPQADGTYDETRFTGARSISIEGVVVGNAYNDIPVINGWPSDVQWNSASWFTTLLSAWASPARRYRLYFTDEIGRSRFMDVRGDSFASQVSKNSDHVREFQLGMVNPSGRIFSFGGAPGTALPGADVTVIPDGRWAFPVKVSSTGDVGRAYPETAPYLRDYPPGSVGFQAVRYGGSVPNGCLIRIKSTTSTIVAPRIIFTSPLGAVSEIGLSAALSIPANTTILIDTIARTVTMQIGAGVVTNVAQYLVAPLQWPQLRPGINRRADPNNAGARGYNKIDFTSSGASAAEVTIYYHDADLL